MRGQFDLVPHVLFEDHALYPRQGKDLGYIKMANHAFPGGIKMDTCK